MYHVMMVDDEEAIADYTSAYLSCLDGLELEVVTAYGAKEALDILHRRSADVVVTDIRMPGMSGLEMLREIRKLWPMCQFILLTAHEQFDYALGALKMDAVDYVVKNEGMPRLEEAVRKAIARIESIAKERHITEKAREIADSAMPFLQREFLMDLAHGVPYTDEHLSVTQQRIGMRIDMRGPLTVAMLLMHLYNKETTLLGRMERAGSVRLLAQTFLPESVHFMQVEVDAYRLVWLLQSPDGLTERLDRLLEGIQRACLTQLSLPISISYAKECAGLSQFPKLYKRLHARQSSYAVGRMVQWIQCVDDDSAMQEEFAHADASGAEAWRKSFERGDPDAKLLLCRLLRPLLAADPAAAAECYLLVSAQFCLILKKMRLNPEQTERIGIRLLYDYEAHGTSRKAYAYLMDLADTIIALRRERSSSTVHAAIARINQYVETNLSGDLSLTHLADVVRMNASYLSRIYKQETGQNLAAYITQVKMNRAKALLADKGNIKVQEISALLGFPNAAYFSYFFRKNAGISPVEYRASVGMSANDRK